MTRARWKVWKHDCIRDGVVDTNGPRPCEPRCDDPWQVDADWPHRGAVFATWAEAMDYSHAESASTGELTP